MTDIEHHFVEGDVKLILRYVSTERVAAYEDLGWIVHHCFVRNGETLVEWIHQDQPPVEPGSEIS